MLVFIVRIALTALLLLWVASGSTLALVIALALLFVGIELVGQAMKRGRGC